MGTVLEKPVLAMSAREKTQKGCEYLPLGEQGLTGSTEFLSGDGSAHNPWQVCVTIENGNKEEWEGVFHVRFCIPGTDPRFFLPGFLYGRNRGEAPMEVANEFPRLRYEDGVRPASSWWMTRSDRLSHPAAFVWAGGKVWGISASPYYVWENGMKMAWTAEKERIWKEEGERENVSFCQYAGFTCSLKDPGIGYTLGYENAPWHFMESHRVREREALGRNCFVLEAGERFSFILFCYEYEAELEKGVHLGIRNVYDRYHTPPRQGGSFREVVDEIGTAVSEDAWMEEECNYSGLVYLKEGKTELDPLTAIGWTNGMAVAAPMLLAGIRLGREEMCRQARACIDHIVAHSINPRSGLPYACCVKGVWHNRGWWFDRMHTPGHTAYVTGQAVYYILKAYDWDRKRWKHWLSFAGNVIEAMEKNRNGEEEYPYIFSEKTGAGLEYDSFAGTWCMAAAALYSRITGDMRYLEGLVRSERHYYEAYVQHAECYGTPLDVDKAPDSEGILAYIRAVRHLHEITGEEKYLDHMKEAFLYEFSFKFCYNSPIQIPPLSTLGWSSCGGSITSVTNPHIHPMSSSITGEMGYYLKCRKDTYVESRLADTLGWSCQTHNRYDGEYDYGRKGWMSERFCHAEGVLAQFYPDGSPASTWFALMPWACGCILEGLASEETWRI